MIDRDGLNTSYQRQKRILSHEVDRKFKGGQPQKKHIKNDMKVLNVSKDLTADRVPWRSAINPRRRGTPAAEKRRH